MEYLQSQKSKIIITIPDPISEVQLSEKRRSHYFICENGIITCTQYSKYIPAKLVKPELLETSKFSNKENLKSIKLEELNVNYKVVSFHKDKPVNSKGIEVNPKYVKSYVCDLRGYKVLANPIAAGTPNTKTINSQSIYSSNLHPVTRNKIVEEIKRSFLKYVYKLNTPKEINYPLRAKLYIFDTVQHNFVKSKDKDNVGQRWDIGNRAYLYAKCMLDLLSTGVIGQEKYFDPIITDDDRLHLTEDCLGGIFCPVNDISERKLVFVLYTDTFYEYYNAIYPFPEEVFQLEVERNKLLVESKFYNNGTNI